MKKILFAILSFAFAVTAAEPILKVGIISDTHVKPSIASTYLLENAFRLFKSHNVDIIANCGDIVDVYNEKSFINYRNTFKKVFTDKNKRPKEIIVFAWHERLGRWKDPEDKVFADEKKFLELEQERHDIFKIKGHTFIVFPQGIDFKLADKMLADACKENPGKPIFVFDHIAPHHTVYNSILRTDRRKMLEKYPQVIQFSGHIHGTLTNELNIWQGDFTAVNVGSLYGWGGSLLGNSFSMASDSAMIMEIYSDKIVMRRFFVKSKKEYQPENRWTLPLKFDKKTAPYNFANRQAKDTVPEFAKNAKLKLAFTPDFVNLSFPHASHKTGVFKYELKFYVQQDNKWNRFAMQEIIGNFMHEGKQRFQPVLHKISNGYFEKGKKYKLEVTPVSFFALKGKTLIAEFQMTTPQKGKVVFESRNPMQECPFISGIEGGKALKIGADGFYDHNVPNARLLFPEKIWDVKTNTRFRLTVDMHMKQSKDRAWSLVMRNPKPLRNANSRINTPYGDSGLFRCVIDFKKQGDNYKYYLLIREGANGKIRFNYVKIEQLD